MMDSGQCCNGQPRVMLWSTPRSCTTAFIRSVSNAEQGKFYYEPYGSAFFYGPEKDSSSVPGPPSSEDAPESDLLYPSSINTFSWVKQMLEADQGNAKFVFVKDFAYCVEGKECHLPKGYRHSFLIRNPYKVIPSWRKMHESYRPPGPMDEQEVERWNDIQIGKYAGYKELFNIYCYVKENLDPNPFVIDADDLLANPEAVLVAYCKATGIPFSRKLLEWDNDGLPMNSKWVTCRSHLGMFECDHHSNARSSCGFVETMTKASLKPVTNPNVLNLIERCMPYYNKLYQQRFVP